MFQYYSTMYEFTILYTYSSITDKLPLSTTFITDKLHYLGSIEVIVTGIITFGIFMLIQPLRYRCGLGPRD